MEEIKEKLHTILKVNLPVSFVIKTWYSLFYLPGRDRFYKFRYQNSPREVYGYGTEAEESQGIIVSGWAFFTVIV